MMNRLTAVMLSGTALLTGVSGPAQAEENNLDEGKVVTLDEIVVTATRRESRIQDIPYNISAVSGADVEAAKMVDTAELLRSRSERGTSVVG